MSRHWVAVRGCHPDCPACEHDAEMAERAAMQKCVGCGGPILGDPLLPDVRDYCGTDCVEVAA